MFYPLNFSIGSDSIEGNPLRDFFKKRFGRSRCFTGMHFSLIGQEYVFITVFFKEDYIHIIREKMGKVTNVFKISYID